MIVMRGQLAAKRAPKEERASTPPPSRLARMLALAWLLDDLAELGALTNAEAARQLGVTRARVSQIARLRFLAPEIQERILVRGTPRTERSVRRVCEELRWEAQRRLVLS